MRLVQREWMKTLGVFSLACLAGLWLFVLPSAVTAGEGEVRRFVERLASDVTEVLDRAGEDDRYKERRLRAMFVEHVDIDWIAQFVLGQYWRQLDDRQRDRYLRAYREYLLARYTTNLAEYSGSDYSIGEIRDEGDGKYSVAMVIEARGTPTDAGYKLRESGGDFKIYDIVVEGVSLIQTGRSEFASVAQREGVDALIRKIDAKTRAEKQRKGFAP